MYLSSNLLFKLHSTFILHVSPFHTAKVFLTERPIPSRSKIRVWAEQIKAAVGVRAATSATVMWEVPAGGECGHHHHHHHDDPAAQTILLFLLTLLFLFPLLLLLLSCSSFPFVFSFILSLSKTFEQRFSCEQSFQMFLDVFY